MGLAALSVRAQVIPQLLDEKAKAGEFLLEKNAWMAAPQQDAEWFAEVLNTAGAAVRPAPADVKCAIQFLSTDFLPDRYPVPQGEGYVIRVTPEVINIHAASRAGHVHALQTLARWIEVAPKTAGQPLRLACRDVVDAPRFAWRGFMLDESRHFTGEVGVKRLIDAMARYKLNRLHWHLTDSPGWRIEIKKYPELTRTGGRGSETNRRADAPVEYYTQDQIRSIVAYAKQREVVIVPEIEMPGHADAAVAAYPEHDGGGFTQNKDPIKWQRFTFNPARKETLTFLDDVLAEVAALFPDAGVIHYGGDEVHFGWKKWSDLPDVRQLMKDEGFKELSEVEGWFSRRMAASINRLGFKAGGWDEIAARGLAKDQTVVWWWRHDKPAILKQALKDGYPVVLCPRRPCYFDFLQHETHREGRTWGGINLLRDVYQFPVSLGLTADEERGVLGIEACLWTEATVTQARRDFMTWPRLVALAESAWTAESRKDFASFEARLKPELTWLTTHHIASWDPFAKTPEVTNQSSSAGYLDKPE